MDKNIYNMKAEKIQKQARNGDYETAAKICDTIDWSQVRSVRMLTLVSSVYEHVHDYDRAIDILLMAYEEAPVGRRYLYKLTELAIQAGEIREAESYYKAYLKEAAEDPSRYLLRYKLAEAKGEPLDKRIAILATYKRQEFDEEWALRLAELYKKAGRREDCVRLCDEIILWFGVGPCVDRAMELKETYEPLSDSQKERRENRNFYEAKLEQMAKESEQESMIPENPFLKAAPAENDDLPTVAISEEMGVSFDESAFVSEEEELSEAEELFEPPKDLRSTREIPPTKTEGAAREIPPLEAEEAFSIGSFVKSVMEEAVEEQEGTVTAQMAAARSEAAAVRAERMETLLKTEGKAETAPEPELFADVPELEPEVFPEAAAEKAITAEPVAEEPMEEPVPDETDEIPEVKLISEELMPEFEEAPEVKPVFEEQMPEFEAAPEVKPVFGDRIPELEPEFEEAPVFEEQLPEAEPVFEENIPEEEPVLGEKMPEGQPVFEEEKMSEEKPILKARRSEIEASMEPQEEPELTLPDEIDRMEADIEEALGQVLDPEPEPEQLELVWDEEPEQPAAPVPREILFVGCAAPADGLNLAVDALRKAYEKVGGEVSQVAKISASKLNSRGLLKSLPNLQGKDLIIVGANALSDTVLREIQQVREEMDPQKFFVLLDRPAALQPLKERLEHIPEEEELPQIVVSETLPDPEMKPKRTPVPPQPVKKQMPQKIAVSKREERENLSRDTELSEEQFISQVKYYAASIDCVLAEDVTDALYDVIDELREDGDPLSPAMAEEIVEDAADEAEHHSIRNLFKSKYNKEGKLILRARHFD